MQLCLILSLVGLALAAPSSLEEDWQRWKKQHGKKYSSDVEESVRKAVWFRAHKHIEDHNGAGTYTYRMGLNKFSDMVCGYKVYVFLLPLSQTNEEFRKLYLRPGMESILPATVTDSKSSHNVSAPSSLDWRSKGFVTRVRSY